MSLGSDRSAVFLHEMGVGPLWRVRQVEAETDPTIDVLAAPAVAAMAAAVSSRPPAAPSQRTGGAPPAAPAGRFGEPAMPSALAAGPAPASAPPAQPAPAAPLDDSTAWFDDAPPPQPVAPVSDAAIAAMDWAELRASAGKCTRCALSRSRRGVVFGRGEERAEWLLVGASPSRGDEKAGRAVSGDAGKLLDNMMRAIGLDQQQVYVTNLIKCRAPGPAGAERAPTPEEITACRPFLERELALTAGKTVLVFGQLALRAFLGEAASASASRGSVHRLDQVRVVATYHPEDLLRQSENKAKAWADLCLARKAHGEPD
ncbi:MAG: uracil-DNA glycosylase [Pseudomonadota bacterium]